jgi:hypothetical protein
VTQPKWRAKITLAVASTVIALVCAELLVRAFGIAPQRWSQIARIERGDKRVGLDLYPDDPRGYFPIDLRDASTRRAYRERGLTDVDARYERTPYAIETVYTEELCRGREIPEGSPRVIALGDSFTEGQGVREEHTFAARLDARLAPARMINCGRRGYDFPGLRERFVEELALDPDVVVYAMVLNDPEQSSAFHARQEYIDDWIVDRRRMFTEGDGSPPPWQPRLFVLLDDRIEGMRIGAETERWYREMVGPENREGWRATLDHLSAMQRDLRARGGELLVVLWPLFVDLEDYPFEATHRTIARAVRARGIEFHDTLGAFRGKDARTLWVHPSDRHPNERAHAIFADEIEPVVRRVIARRS